MQWGLVQSPNAERCYFTLMMAASHTVPVLLHEAFLLVIGHFGIFEECIIQPLRKTDPVLGLKCWTNSFLNHFLFMPLLLAFAAYPIFVMYSDISSLVLPSLSTQLWHLLICVVLEDFLFYWSHRILHHPMLYKHFHKKHHEFKVLTGYSIASEYTHPVESVLGNIIPVMAGPYVTACHFSTSCMWIVLRMLKTCDAHSGYAFNWSPFGFFYPLNPTERHDFHHETGLGSFGSFFLLWDQWTGTDAAYLQSCVEKRARRGARKALDSKSKIM